MTTQMSRKPLVASGVAVLLASLLAGCGGGGDLDAFCADAQPILDGSFLADVDLSDPDAVQDEIDAAVATIEDVDAPSEIEDDWETSADAMREYLDATKDAENSEEALEKLQVDEVQTAGDNVETFVEENCEATDAE